MVAGTGIMMDHNFFNADPWQTDTYAMKYGAHEMSRANGVAQQSCNALLGFGLPASSGKSFVDKLWSTTVPKRDCWNGVLYMLAMLDVRRSSLAIRDIHVAVTERNGSSSFR